MVNENVVADNQNSDCVLCTPSIPIEQGEEEERKDDVEEIEFEINRAASPIAGVHEENLVEMFSQSDEATEEELIEILFNCSRCKKKFRRKENLQLHEKHCIDSRKDLVLELPKKQARIEDYFCNNETKLLSEEVKGTIQLGAGDLSHDDHNEQWKMPDVINRSFNDNLMTYRKDFNQQNKQNLLDRFRKMLEMYKNIIKIHVAERGIKFYFSLKVIFHKLVDITEMTDPPVCLRSDVFTALVGETDISFMEEAFSSLIQKIETFEQNGSGWTLDRFVNLDLGKILFRLFSLSINEYYQNISLFFFRLYL